MTMQIGDKITHPGGTATVLEVREHTLIVHDHALWGNPMGRCSVPRSDATLIQKANAA